MAATGPRASGGLFELESYLRCQGFEAIALVSPTCLASNRISFTPKRNVTAGRSSREPTTLISVVAQMAEWL